MKWLPTCGVPSTDLVCPSPSLPTAFAPLSFPHTHIHHFYFLGHYPSLILRPFWAPLPPVCPPSPSGPALLGAFPPSISPGKSPPPPREGSYLWWRGLERTRTPPIRQDGCHLGRRVLCPPSGTVVCRPRPKPLSSVALLLGRGSAWGTYSAAR